MIFKEADATKVEYHASHFSHLRSHVVPPHFPQISESNPKHPQISQVIIWENTIQSILRNFMNSYFLLAYPLYYFLLYFLCHLACVICCYSFFCFFVFLRVGLVRGRWSERILSRLYAQYGA